MKELVASANRQTPLDQANRHFGFLWGGMALSLVLLSPLGHRFALALPRCHIKSWFGVPCPGCGTTRSALALSQFDFLAALAVNPLATMVWIAIIVGGFVAGALALTHRRVPEPPSRLSKKWRWGVVLVVAANWVYLVAHGS